MVTLTYSPAYGEPPMHQPFYGANPAQATKRFFMKYANFTGRASRSEFWWPLLVIWGCLQVSNIVGTVFSRVEIAAGIFDVLLIIGSITPFFAVATRRMHDINLSGKWLWLLLGASTLGIYIFLIIVIQTLGYALTETPSSAPIFITIFMMLLGFLATTICWITFVVFMAKPSVDAGVRFDVIRTVIPVVTGAPQTAPPDMPLPYQS
ncbi:DUF805 domain-containing protein [Alloscardovia omnicolens]|uniref:DUF805 domain-containing protein n=1 Tax=Alloscardovia omnicolens TaxID=419015 RepID=UPI003A6778B5